MSNNITLLALRLFVDVASYGNFSEVARRRGLPTSSVSRHIGALEKQLGQTLLFRSTRAVRLTEAGDGYFREVRELLRGLDLAAETVGSTADAPRGLLRINAPVAFGRRHIAPHLAAFQTRYPALVVELDLTDVFVDPVSEGADVVVRIGALQDSGLMHRKLAEQRYVVAAAPDYLARHGTPTIPAELGAHNCLVYKGTRGEMAWLFGQGQRALLPQTIKGNLRSNDADCLIEGALQGQGVVLFPTWLLHDPIAQGRLVPILTGWDAAAEPDPVAINMLFVRDRVRAAKMTVFIEYLAEVTGRPPYWDNDG